MDTKKLSTKLLLCWWSIYVVAGIIVLLYETGKLQTGTVTTPKTIYIMQVVAVVLSLALIPISLKGFKSMCNRLDEKDYPFEKKFRIYSICSYLHIEAYFIVVVYSVLLYYLINDDIGLYCGLIGFICSLFCYPTYAAVCSELGE